MYTIGEVGYLVLQAVFHQEAVFFLYLFLPGECWHMPDAKTYSGGCMTKANQEIQGENEKNSFI